MQVWTETYIEARERGIWTGATKNVRLRLAAILQYEFIKWLATVDLLRVPPSQKRITALAKRVNEVVNRLDDPRATDPKIPSDGLEMLP